MLQVKRSKRQLRLAFEIQILQDINYQVFSVDCQVQQSLKILLRISFVDVKAGVLIRDQVHQQIVVVGLKCIQSWAL